MSDKNKNDRPVMIRHQMSGVWIGYITGEGTYPQSVRLEGRRIWSWVGGRLELSQVAAQGCRQEDKLGEWEEVEIGSLGTQLVELRTIDRATVEKARALKSHQV